MDLHRDFYFAVVEPGERVPTEPRFIDKTESSQYGHYSDYVPPQLSRMFKDAKVNKEPDFTKHHFIRTQTDRKYCLESLLDPTLLSGIPFALRDVEIDSLKKAEPATGQIAGYFVPDKPFGTKNQHSFPIELENFMTKVFDALPRTPISMTNAAPTGTNTGFGTWLSGNHFLNAVGFAMNSVAAGAVMTDYKRYYKKMERIFPYFESCYTNFTRVRQTHKWIQKWEFSDSGCFVVSEERGKKAHRRSVRGGDQAKNMAKRPAAIEIKEKMASEKALKVEPEYVMLEDFMRFRNIGCELIAVDASNYDEHISKAMLVGNCNNFASVLNKYNQLEMWKDSATTPILGPGLDSSERSFLYSRDGSLASGDTSTDIDGSWTNFKLQIYAVTEAIRHSRKCPKKNWSYQDTYNALYKDWYCKIKGDDLVVALPVYADRNHYLAAVASMGINVTLVDGISFLMTYYDLENKSYYGLLSRGLIQTWFREHPAAGFYTLNFGLLSRTLRLVKHPKFNHYWELIVNHPRFLENTFFRHRPRFQDYYKWIFSPDFLAGFEEEVATQEGKKWLTDYVRGITRGSSNLADAISDPKIALILQSLKLPATSADSKKIINSLGLNFDSSMSIYSDWVSLVNTELYDKEGNQISKDDLITRKNFRNIVNPLLKSGIIDENFKLNKQILV